MDYIVSYSGGIGSFCAAHRLMQSVPKERIKLVFCDTLIEDEDLYRFLDESAKALGLELVRLADGRNPWQVFTDLKYQGSSKYASCSHVLKRDLMDKWLFEKYPDGNFTMVLGISFEESERLETAKRVRKGKVNIIAPLCDKPYMFHHDRLELVKSFGIELPRLYKLGFPHNNCGGFCVRAGLTQFKKLLHEFPERYEWHRQQQEKLHSEVPSAAHPFLKDRRGGQTKYISLTEFKEINQNDIPTFDFGGCACFVDDGEESNLKGDKD